MGARFKLKTILIVEGGIFWEVFSEAHNFKNFFSHSTVSNLALSEYENLHSKFEVEQSCRNKAEEFATNVGYYFYSIIHSSIIDGDVYQFYRILDLVAD